jgi:hypothetical protein
VNTNLRVLGLFKKKKAYPSVEDHARAGRIVGENDTGGNGISIRTVRVRYSSRSTTPSSRPS